MGMLSGIDPEESYSKGFKDNLTSEMANTIALAKRQWTWCNERGLSLGALALQCAPPTKATTTTTTPGFL